MDSSDYLDIHITLSPFDDQNAEIIEAELSEIGFDAFMSEAPVLHAYIQSSLLDKDAFSGSLEGLSHLLGITISYEILQMPKTNWNATWEQEGFTPIMVDNQVTIKPEGKDLVEKTRFEIDLQANMAFGTGHHHTTFMMMQNMLDIEPVIKGSDVVDLGCGTAVLAILAKKMDAKYVEAIDIDATAARSADDNVARNGVDIVVKCGDASLLNENSIDVLLANIHRNIIIADLGTYSKAVRDGGYLLISGFYDTDIEDIKTAAESSGFKIQSTRTNETWASLVLRK